MDNKNKQKIIIVYGGQSTEHDASKKSFEYLCSRINSVGLRGDLQVSHILYVTRDGKATISNYDKTKDASYYEKNDNYVSIFDAFKFIKKNGLFAYTILHGQNGEDGRAQGVSDFFSLRSDFGSVLSCTLGMSKYHFNQYLKGNFTKIKFPETVCLRNPKNIEKEIVHLKGKEIVVKPNSLGASILTEKFILNDEFFSRILGLCQRIFEFDVMVLIQEYIKGIEYSCGCLEKDEEVIVFPLVRIETPNNFFGHKEKHIQGYSKEILIEEIDDTKLLQTAKDVMRKIFCDLNFRHAARFDFIVRDNDIFFLEVNPLPGIMKNSIFPKMLRSKGWDVEDLIAICFDNEKSRKKVKTEFKYKID